MSGARAINITHEIAHSNIHTGRYSLINKTHRMIEPSFHDSNVHLCGAQPALLSKTPRHVAPSKYLMGTKRVLCMGRLRCDAKKEIFSLHGKY